MSRIAPSHRDYKPVWFQTYPNIKCKATRLKALLLSTEYALSNGWTWLLMSITFPLSIILMFHVGDLYFLYATWNLSIPSHLIALFTVGIVIFVPGLFITQYVLHDLNVMITARVLSNLRIKHCPNCGHDIAFVPPGDRCPECALPDADPTNPHCVRLHKPRSRAEKRAALASAPALVLIVLAGLSIPSIPNRPIQPTAWTPPPVPYSSLPATPTEYLSLARLSTTDLALAGLPPEHAPLLAERLESLRDVANAVLAAEHFDTEVRTEIDRLAHLSLSAKSKYKMIQYADERMAIAITHGPDMSRAADLHREYVVSVLGVISEFLPEFKYPPPAHLRSLPDEFYILRMSGDRWQRLESIYAQLQSDPDSLSAEDRTHWESFYYSPAVVTAREGLTHLPTIEAAFKNPPSP